MVGYSIWGFTFRKAEDAVGVARSAVAITLGTITGLCGITLPSRADYSSQVRPGWQPNGSVYAIVRAGDRVILGGSFTTMTNLSTGETVGRTRIAALDAATGDLDRSWTSSANDTVQSLAVSPDGSRVFAGGRFTTLGGQSRGRVAELDAQTGQVLPSWNPGADSSVRALALIGGTLYLGGAFGRVGGLTRTRLAAVDTNSGTVRSDWISSADGYIYSLAPSTDGTRVVVGGEFRQLGGQSRDFVGSVSAATGAVTAFHPPASCLGTNPCTALDVATGPGRVYAGLAGPGGRVAAYDETTGTRVWQVTGDGDVESVAVEGNLVYAGGHFSPDFGDSQRYGLAAIDAATGALDPAFVPRLGGIGSGAVVALDAGTDELRIGGGFQQVNGVAKPYYAEFPVAAPPVEAIPAGATWRYDDSGADLGSAWAAPGYDDSAWASGSAQLGFGDGDESTAVGPGHVTYYFRHAFDVADASTLSQAVLSLVRDDGAVVYVNGVEAMRSNMPAGPVMATTLASSTVGGADESAWQSQVISPSLLHAGTNIIAVEVHQAAASSSDVSFDLRLTLR